MVKECTSQTGKVYLLTGYFSFNFTPKSTPFMVNGMMTCYKKCGLQTRWAGKISVMVLQENN